MNSPWNSEASEDTNEEEGPLEVGLEVGLLADMRRVLEQVEAKLRAIKRQIEHSKRAPHLRVFVLLPLTPVVGIGAGAKVRAASAGAKSVYEECNITRGLLHYQGRTISKGPSSLMQQLRSRRPSVDPEEWIGFFALRTHCVDRWGCVHVEQVYAHAKLLVVDDETVMIGSANVSDRSLSGGRDSEIALLITDNSRTEQPVKWAGGTRKLGKFAHQLRVRCMEQHLNGTNIDIAPADTNPSMDMSTSAAAGSILEQHMQSVISSSGLELHMYDPISLGFELWRRQAARNTECYRELGGGGLVCIPSDECRSYSAIERGRRRMTSLPSGMAVVEDGCYGAATERALQLLLHDAQGHGQRMKGLGVQHGDASDGDSEEGEGGSESGVSEEEGMEEGLEEGMEEGLEESEVHGDGAIDSGTAAAADGAVCAHSDQAGARQEGSAGGGKEGSAGGGKEGGTAPSPKVSPRVLMTVVDAGSTPLMLESIDLESPAPTEGPVGFPAVGSLPPSTSSSVSFTVVAGPLGIGVAPSPSWRTHRYIYIYISCCATTSPLSHTGIYIYI